MSNIITVFTPTYNRAYCLSKCYDSMKRQTCQNFDWLIIDDGSSDNTEKLVQQWMREDHKFTIRYIYKENGGMHTAYNVAYEMIETELAMNIDSDDYLTDTAIEDIVEFWGVNKRDDIGGIYALDQYENRDIVGRAFPDDLKEFHGWGYRTIFYENGGRKKRYHNKGDKKFIGVTSIIKQYPPIPVFKEEKYHSLYYKQHLIERDYTILILNKPVCIVEYLDDGSSKNMYTQYIKNPLGFCDERRFVMEFAPTIKLRLEAAVHYVAESIIAGDTRYIANSTNKPATVLATPLGILLFFWIERKTKQ